MRVRGGPLARAVWLVLCCAGSAEADPRAASRAPTFLFQSPLHSGGVCDDTISLALESGAWRVGSVDGPPASVEQLETVLEDLRGLLLAHRCDADTGQPRHCISALGRPQFAGVSSHQTGDKVLGWVATDPTLDDSPAGFLGLLQPQRYGAAGSSAFGARLALRFKSSLRFLPTCGDATGTALVIHNDDRGRFAMPPQSGEHLPPRALAQDAPSRTFP